MSFSTKNDLSPEPPLGSPPLPSPGPVSRGHRGHQGLGAQVRSADGADPGGGAGEGATGGGMGMGMGICCVYCS